MPPLRGTLPGLRQLPEDGDGPARSGRARYLTATALGRSVGLGGLPAALLALPLALSPAGAEAATISIPSTCTLTGPGVCNATALIPTPSAGDTIAFKGGVLTMNGNKSYPDQATLTNSTGNTINQDGNSNTFSGVFADTLGNAGAITITNINPVNGNQLTAGTVTFSGANIYTGPTTINTGATLALTGSGSVASSSVVNVNTGATLALDNTTTIKSLAGGGSVTFTSSNKTLTLSNAADTFSGTISGGNANTTLTVNGGTESLMGSVTIKGDTTVDKGATLTGTGSVGTGTTKASLVNNGTVKPFNTVSNSTGTLTVGKNYTQGTTGVLDFAIGGTTAGTYSTLAVTGAASLAGTLAIQTVNNYLFPNAATTYDNIISYGTLSGSGLGFTNLTYNGNSCAPHGMETWSCHHITFQAINLPSTKGVRLHVAPEPGTLAVLGTSLLGLLALRRRRA
jgi:autotransporter-associated beta strand protein